MLLRCVGLTKAFKTEAGPVHALRGIDLRIARGEFVAVTGPSGSGKSTLLHVLGGLEPSTSGEIWLNNKRVDGLTPARWARLRRQHIGFVFQFFNLIGGMSVADNVEIAALVGGASAREARARREELLEDLGLSAKARTAPSELSGGEQQRVAVARALAHRPSLLLTDEPTGNLDSSNTSAVLRLLRRNHAQGQAILLVTHDARAASMADRVVNLFDGMIVDDAAVRSAPLRESTVSRVVDLTG
ncbi:MAG TPA: ABC transporter ATP-binding protein [Streptosporangiaceae bacterium]|nr:ABC transporter ATP-binding protein [Streptosporangiaceae bacterium]